MKYLVTGATGQVGHSLVGFLLDEKVDSPEDIVCLVRTPEKAKNLQEKKVTVVQGSLNDIAKIKKIFDDNHIESVFHVGAISDPSVDKELIFSTNVDGSNNVLKAFVESEAHCFVFASSISVYDMYLKVDGNKIDEEADIGSLTKGDTYARSKRIIEQEIQSLQSLHPEKRFKIARIGPICGTHDRIVLPKLISIMSKKSLPKLINKGMLEMSIVAPEDVARGMVFLAKNSNGVPDVVYNVTGEMITFKNIFGCVADYYGIRHPKFSVPLWFFKMLRPAMWLTRVLFPKNDFVKLVFSETALAFFSNNYEYDRTKIEKLGFEFRYTPLQSIRMGLETMDPEKSMIK